MITQAYISRRIRSRYQEGFLKLWDLKPYNSEHEPTIFIGMYDDVEFRQIKNHKGFKVLLQTGSRDYNQNDKYIQMLTPTTHFVDVFYCHFPRAAKVKNVRIPMKDFSDFKPNVLGDKIYVYLCNERLKERYGYKIVQKITRAVKREILIAYYTKGVDYKKLYYDRCFVNLNLSPSGCGGFTTAYELGYMGRKSLTNSTAGYPMFEQFGCLDDLIDKINIESKKIGTIQPSLMDGFHTFDNSWKNINFWQ